MGGVQSWGLSSDLRYPVMGVAQSWECPVKGGVQLCQVSKY